MNGRELLGAVYSGEQADRFPFPSVSGWGETIERWNTEGLPQGVDANQHMGLISDDYVGLPLDLNMVPKFPIQILEEGPEYVTLVDEFSVTKKIIRSDYDRSGGYQIASGNMSSMSQWIDFPVKDMRTWKSIYEERFQPDIDGRVPDHWEDFVKEHNRLSETRWSMYSGYPLFGFFGPMRELMGLEGLIYAIADDPNLIHTIAADLSDFWLVIFDKVLKDVRVDQIIFFEDMCATKAPLMSPAMFREFISPYYRKVTNALKDMGVRECWIDTDGNAWDLIPEMIDCGITGMLPCEAQSDMDVARIRDRFPDFNIIGGIDKRALTAGPDQIDEEIDRCYKVAWTKSRYIPALDHGAPPDISWQNIQYFAEICKQRCTSPIR